MVKYGRCREEKKKLVAMYKETEQVCSVIGFIGGFT